MEYLGGGELKWKNSQDEPVLTVFQARRICRDVMLGLEYRKSPSVIPSISLTFVAPVHYQGIIHRDIKPANIVWDTKRSMVKITDFGVSHFSYAQRLSGKVKSDDDDPDDPILLDDSDLAKRAGTPFYLAPEVVQSDWDENTVPDEDYTPPPRPPITKAIDIWALGVTLYSLLFGRTPFTIPNDRPQHEFQIYRIICTEDWGVPETMGADRLPTGGRHPTPADEDGYPVVNLLDHLLQKDASRRITIDELKVRYCVTVRSQFTDCIRCPSEREMTGSLEEFMSQSNGDL
jgi:SNF1-activating kinase 1